MARFEDLSIEEWNAVGELLAHDRLPLLNESLDELCPPEGLYARVGKRALDVVVSSAALLVTLPLNAVFAFGTYLDVGRPLLFRQLRVGRGGRTFELVKFRNMTNETDDNGNLLPASRRVTRFGRFMRRTSMDELLNFWSVLKGDMSIIGPRPMPEVYQDRYNKRHAGRTLVRPGLECPPRHVGKHYRSWQEQLDNDAWYVEHVSLRTDLYLFWRLVCYALDRRSSDARADGDERGSFMGYGLDGIAITETEVPEEYIARAVEIVKGAQLNARKDEMAGDACNDGVTSQAGTRKVQGGTPLAGLVQA